MWFEEKSFCSVERWNSLANRVSKVICLHHFNSVINSGENGQFEPITAVDVGIVLDRKWNANKLDDRGKNGNEKWYAWGIRAKSNVAIWLFFAGQFNYGNCKSVFHWILREFSESLGYDSEQAGGIDGFHVAFNSSSNDITLLKCTFHLHFHRCSVDFTRHSTYFCRNMNKSSKNYIFFLEIPYGAGKSRMPNDAGKKMGKNCQANKQFSSIYPTST